MSGARVAVAAAPARAAEGEALAHRLALPLLRWGEEPAGYDFLLALTAARLELRPLQWEGGAPPGPVYVDWVGGAAGHRRRFGGGKGQPIAKAVGIKGAARPALLDATAGLGRDAFVLATLGCAVTLVERSPLVAALLADGLRRAAADPETAPIAARLRLLEGDGPAVMAGLAEGERPEAVYLDPMYPEREKSALAKKEMRLLRPLVGDDLDAPRLLAAALACARKRVVVKRPRLAPAIAGPPPALVLAGSSTRFDIYFPAAG